ncbi:MAG: hypothetical protein IPM25_20100 [Chloracidobacterium sp.]|nr:hypothetical protein [Chloracidobacterium sp.]
MKASLITGASGGIYGEAFARHLLLTNTTLVLVARSADKQSTLAEELEGKQEARSRQYPNPA